MKPHRSLFLLLSTAAVHLLASQSIRSQSTLTLQFHDHDGSVAEEAVYPVLRTGSLEGTLTGITPGTELEYVWAFYNQASALLYCETGTGANDRAYFVFHREDHLLVATSNGCAVSLPVATHGFPQLPVGTFIMRFWAASPGNMTFDSTTGVPTSGAQVDLQMSVTVQNVAFAVYTPNPRNLVIGETARFRALTSSPVEQDTYLTVIADDALGELSTSQILIPQGQTCSADFTLEVGTSLVAGQIAFIDDAGYEHRSSMLRSALALEVQFEGTGAGSLPEVTFSSWCKHKAVAINYGDGEEVCSNPSVNPTAPIICQAPNGTLRIEYTKAKCAGAWYTACHFFNETVNHPQYKAGLTYSKPPSGSTTGQTSGGVQVGGTVNVGPVSGSGQVSGSSGSTTTAPLYQKCCKIDHMGWAQWVRPQCKTI